ncbi:hypothetical protein [Rhodococcus sp. IEGM 1408]|uniref:hypothetical protein n=1 Tax=Rhodococcus sp. IEGM 1408 TaxID=3082220 RepID=UPI002954E968|nr:hypothetical protein [Rhodococcus sp. IEGM 1408]MDV8002728.1 hypothetical protein [Rhodococcus sp. IEGM 1408]
MSRRPGPASESIHPVVVPEQVWREWERRHAAAVDLVTTDHLMRRRRGEPHPVVDFLFTYYRTSVASIRRWHPGPGMLLENAHLTDRVDWRHYERDSLQGRTGLVVDPCSVLDRCGPRIQRAREVVEATADRPGATGCFGLHEWAMLYGTGDNGGENDGAGDIRHGTIPLRLSHRQIDEVVIGSRLQCTHFDAYRFFTTPATPLNRDLLTRESQPRNEQPGCLHAGMDIYAQVAAMEAGAPGELLVDALLAAFDAREVDMRSSPYDLSAWGLDPIPVETPEGRTEFVAYQRRWIRRTQILRARFLDAVTRLESSGTAARERTAIPQVTRA